MNIQNYTQTMRTIAVKEIRGFFNSPVAYIVIMVFLLLAGWFFASPIFLINQVTIEHLLVNIPLLFIFIIPAITMRLFAEEFKIGTIESLSVQPIEDYEVIIGKYAAAVFLLAVCIAGTLIHPISLMMLGKLDWGQVLCSYLGLMLMGSSYIAMGIFASSLTRNQIVAFIFGFLFCFVFFIFGKIIFFMPGILKNIISFLSMDTHFDNIAKGIIDLRDMLYYVSIIGAFLYATLLVVINRRWR
ncbi:MAG: ABC transporter [bacterium]